MELKALGFRTYFCAGWNDVIGYLCLTDGPDYTAIGGRSDRADSGDIEPMCHFNIDRVKVIARGKW